jgi:hypothetical protein
MARRGKSANDRANQRWLVRLIRWGKASLGEFWKGILAAIAAAVVGWVLLRNGAAKHLQSDLEFGDKGSPTPVIEKPRRVFDVIPVIPDE